MNKNSLIHIIPKLSPIVPDTWEPPEILCPFCHRPDKLVWARFNAAEFKLAEQLATSKCDNCQNYAIWLGKEIIFPGRTQGYNPNMPNPAKSTFLEALAIGRKSPPAAAAILRRCVLVICNDAACAGHTMADYLSDLVKRGLPRQIQDIFEKTRLVGDRAVEPGMICPEDDMKTVEALCATIDLIVEVLYTAPSRARQVQQTFTMERPAG